MSDDLDQLNKLAEAATPGPWSGGVCRAYRDDDGKRRGAGSVRREGGAIVFMSANGPEILEDDVKFIAAANPAVVRELIERVRKAARAHRLVAKLYGKATAERDAALAREAKVRELHAKHRNTLHTIPEYVCAHRNCVDDMGDQCAYPCPTIRALDADGKETNE